MNHLLFADDTMFFCRSDRASCEALVKILSCYELASGQCINRNKSAITFSSKTLPATKHNNKTALCIGQEGGIRKYLGLIEHFGRRKRDIFASIVDRIKQKAHGWKTRFLSGAGKLVLLKTVLAAMPSYVMSCFKLPLSLCKQIQLVLTRFWWDLKPEHKRLCWVAWDKLTQPKSVGGLDFRDIEHFNDALLAKLTWRLLKNPSSLLGQMILGNYCRSISLFDFPTSGAISHGWRGILAGREVLKLGVGWAIGNGRVINLWSEKWLSTSEVKRLIGPPSFEEQDLTVRDLLYPDSSEWNLEAVRSCLPQYEESIRLIHPSSYNMEDALVWLPGKTGCYTTKSGYALSKLASEREKQQPVMNQFGWKACVWNVETSPKLKIFFVKLANKAIPVAEALARRGINATVTCKRCNAPEREIHTFFQCPFAKKFGISSLLYINLVPRPLRF